MLKVLLVVAFAAVAVAASNALDSRDAVASTLHAVGDKCKTTADCGGAVAALRCNALTKKCERICTKAGDKCKADGDCCSSTCRDGVCLCFAHGATCTWGDECCDNSCSASKGCCRKAGTECDTHGQCCSGICQAPVAPKPSLLEADADAAPKKAADDCADDKKSDAKGKAKAPAAPAPVAAKKDEKKADAKKPAAEKKPEKKAAPKKMVPASKQCCSDFGQKCSDTEPCCPPNICSAALGMCTLDVKID